MENNFPVIGKFYIVKSGTFKGFIGECVSVDFDSPLPIILEDLMFYGAAVKPDEIEETLKQPGQKWTQNQN